MEATARPLLRPLTGLASQRVAAAASRPAAASLQQQQVRQQSTRQRTGRMLKIRPHESFLPGEAVANHIVFNPPAAAPSVLNTPFKFLPPTDPRRRANLTSLLRTSADLHTGARVGADGPAPALDAARQVPMPTYNVTREQVTEMRRLRAEDPAKWSVGALAEKFACSKLFVMMCCKASAEHRAEEKKRLEAIKARWGPIRRNAREERQKRRTMLLRGEL